MPRIHGAQRAYRSVGCTVIELLEGKPPYHFLDPMPALFRIVNDDSPPIPEGASPIVKDFLYHCFQKDCNLRISAKKLLRHPWMVAARRQMAGHQRAAEGAGNGVEKRPTSNYNYDEAVLKVQEWNEALKCRLVCVMCGHGANEWLLSPLQTLEAPRAQSQTFGDGPSTVSLTVANEHDLVSSRGVFPGGTTTLNAPRAAEAGIPAKPEGSASSWCSGTHSGDATNALCPAATGGTNRQLG